MFAKIVFIQKTGLGTPYSYRIDDTLAKALKPMDYVVVTSARTDYSVGVFAGAVEHLPDESIATARVVQKVDVKGYEDPTLPDMEI